MSDEIQRRSRNSCLACSLCTLSPKFLPNQLAVLIRTLFEYVQFWPATFWPQEILQQLNVPTWRLLLKYGASPEEQELQACALMPPVQSQHQADHCGLSFLAVQAHLNNPCEASIMWYVLLSLRTPRWCSWSSKTPSVYSRRSGCNLWCKIRFLIAVVLDDSVR